MPSDPVEVKCPACGRSRSEWRYANSEGVTVGGLTYCCEGCAKGTRCICELLQTVPMEPKDRRPPT
jgi:hypothetical protein